MASSGQAPLGCRLSHTLTGQGEPAREGPSQQHLVGGDSARRHSWILSTKAWSWQQHWPTLLEAQAEGAGFATGAWRPLSGSGRGQRIVLPRHKGSLVTTPLGPTQISGLARERQRQAARGVKINVCHLGTQERFRRIPKSEPPWIQQWSRGLAEPWCSVKGQSIAGEWLTAARRRVFLLRAPGDRRDLPSVLS